MALARVVESIRQDVRYACRLCLRAPAFAGAAIVSLALAIGANTLVFSVVNGLLLRPLPVESPDELVFVQSTAGLASHSFPNYRDFRDRNTTLSGLIGYRISPMSLDLGGGATRVWGYLATGNYFEVLGIRPVVGRFFSAADDRRPGAAPFAVLSYDAWQRRFHADPAVIGTTIRINQLPYTVLGVAPRGFHGTEIFYRPEIWVPMMMQAQIEVGNPWLEARQTWNTWVLGRLRPGVTRAQAEANLDAIAADLKREYPAVNRNLAITLAPPGLIGDGLRAPVRAFGLAVLVLASLVLLIGCANLASILLAHGADRAHEMALRTSIGAGRGRLVQQLMVESLLLAAAGGVAGGVLGWFASDALSAWQLPLGLPVQFDVTADWRVFGFAVAASTAAGLLFGILPARHASRVDPNSVLKGDVWQPASGRRRWALRDMLVVVQVALCFVLLAASLLSVKGLQQALSMPLGFRSEGVAVAGFELGLAGYTEEQGRLFQERALAAVRRLPGTEAAAYSNSLPLSIDQSTTTVSPERPAGDEPGVSAISYQISPGFLHTLGVRLLAGRDFGPQDRRGSPPVAIVNETLARRVFGTSDALGKRLRYGRGVPVEVVGIVEDGKYRSLTESPTPAVFQPILQRYNSTTTLVVRSRLPEGRMAGEIRRAIASLDPALPVYSAGSLDSLLRFAWLPSRAAAVALTGFAVLAAVLAATGIHGLVAFSVSRRQKEIGIRIAVGAGSVQIVKLVLARAAAALGAGVAIGLALALAAGPLLASVVYLASPREPAVIAGVALLLIGIGLTACWAPLRRSLGTDPLRAIRS